MANSLFFFLIIFSFSNVAFASDTALSNALDILANSGFLSMALTLQITSKTLDLDSKIITIFAPSDLAFVQSGRLSLLQLQYHISPLQLYRNTLKSLPFGTRIPTLLSNHSLIVTTSDFNAPCSINGIFIDESPLYDEGPLVIYGMNAFFDTSFHFTTSTSFSAHEPSPPPTTIVNNFSSQSELKQYGFEVAEFGKASNWLRLRGYTTMATFLGLQLSGFRDHTRLTIFAPPDEAMEAYVTNITDYLLIFRQHIVPRLLSWKDMGRLSNGTILQTFSEGFVINLTWSGDVLVLNGAPVIVLPDMYTSNWLVVHGLNRLLMPPVNQKIIGESFSELFAEDDNDQPEYK
ncbi:putative fasciclin-like arabinogalactan protein 20 [Mangifera indica]|uniref:putative fasciclin-like arabinogalactan protein 20 n=1 Tax=Mangifera indica TaxID=29780 RepID=UPI001CFB69D6|nr:putative fasciclin-like arabinogalactan protein 20 [Mangifera indica]